MTRKELVLMAPPAEQMARAAATMCGCRVTCDKVVAAPTLLALEPW